MNRDIDTELKNINSWDLVENLLDEIDSEYDNKVWDFKYSYIPGMGFKRKSWIEHACANGEIIVEIFDIDVIDMMRDANISIEDVLFCFDDFIGVVCDLIGEIFGEMQEKIYSRTKQYYESMKGWCI